ncbi:MAG: FecR family protein [Bryobacteraceae bacterium]|nr:FecR family protein [Bryobacteraceae bacterium]
MVRRATVSWMGMAACAVLAPCAAFAQIGLGDAARVIRAQGNVSAIRDTQAWAISAGATIQPKQEIVTGHDGYALLEIADGSRIEVFGNTRFVYRQNPGGLRDLIDVWIGRVKVHIQKLGGAPNPNRVRTPTAVISVRGTTFDVSVEDDGDVTFVFVEEGMVAVQHAVLPFTEPKTLRTGEYLRVFKNAPLAKVRFDKGMIVQRTLRALSDMATMRPRIGGGGTASGGTAPGGVGGGLPGDSGGTTPPPPPPPPGGTP